MKVDNQVQSSQLSEETSAISTHEERLYEIAANELANDQPKQGIWAKAFSLALGEELKAKALYIKLRVEQLESDYHRSASEVIDSSRDRITSGNKFVCPYCAELTTATCQFTNFSADRTRNGSEYQYLCDHCGAELLAEGGAESKQRPAAQQPAIHAATAPSNNTMALVGFILGLVSVVLYMIGIIPLLAVVFSGIGLATFKPESQKNKWMAGVGLGLGILYTFMMMNAYGHIR